MTTRRELLRSLLPGRRPAPTPPPAPRSLPVHRPPGAVAEPAFLAGCTRCGECFQACPHQALVPAPARLREAAGTPVIEAAESPCWDCPERPCARACPTGVISPDLPSRMGTARIERLDCLAWQRSFCTVCEERCPVEGALVSLEGRPTVNAESCTGCGVCLHVCPAPRKAVVLTPRHG